VAVFRKTAGASAPLAPLAGAVLLAGSCSWVSRGFRYGNGFRAGLGYSPGLWNAGRSVVFYRPASVPDGASRKHRGASPVDDPQLRADSSRGDAPHLLAPYALRVALVFPIIVCHRVMGLLDSEFADCGMDSAAAGTESTGSQGRLRPEFVFSASAISVSAIPASPSVPLRI
jgi:hypothetical protein